MSKKVTSTSSDTVRITSDSNIDISASSGETGMEDIYSTGISPENLKIKESYHHDENIQIPSYLVNEKILNTIENDALSTNPSRNENATDIITDSEEKVKSVFLVAGVHASCKDIPKSKLCPEELKNGSPLNLETLEMKQDYYNFQSDNSLPPPYTDEFYCDACKVSYSEAGAHDSNRTCNVCKEIFECKMKLADHYLTHEEFHATYCRICHCEIDKHETRREGKWQYQCCACGYRCFKSVLKRHLYIHSPLKLFKCEYCGIRFKQTQNLKTHFKNFHPVCELCGKLFISDISLDKHRLKKHSKT